MNKPLLAVVAILAALLIVPAAAASGSQFLNYEGYSHSPPGIGSTASATIDTKSINVYVTDGDGASWVGVDSGNAASYDPTGCVNGTGNTGIAWIQAGLLDGYGASPRLYVEYKPNLDHCAHLIDEGPRRTTRTTASPSRMSPVDSGAPRSMAPRRASSRSAAR